MAFETVKPLNPQKFLSFLDNLPKNLFRMKGICYFGMKGYEQKYIVQLVGKTIDIYSEEWKDETPKTELVLIGSKIDKAEILAKLSDLEDKNPDEITPQNMVNFERFFLSK